MEHEACSKQMLARQIQCVYAGSLHAQIHLQQLRSKDKAQNGACSLCGQASICAVLSTWALPTISQTAEQQQPRPYLQ